MSHIRYLICSEASTTFGIYLHRIHIWSTRRSSPDCCEALSNGALRRSPSSPSSQINKTMSGGISGLVSVPSGGLSLRKIQVIYVVFEINSIRGLSCRESSFEDWSPYNKAILITLFMCANTIDRCGWQFMKIQYILVNRFCNNMACEDLVCRKGTVSRWEDIHYLLV